MRRLSVPHAVRIAVVVTAALAAALPALAADNVPNNTGTVNCGDSSTSSSCTECCSGQPGCTFGKITCCPLVGSCTVIPGSGGGGKLPLKISEVVGGLKLQFERKLGSDGSSDIKLKVSFLKSIFPRGLKLKAHLTGSDARIAGLLFPVVFLGQGDQAINTLHSAGYDVTVNGTFPTCESLFPQQLCGDMAGGLSRSIYGAIGIGIRTEVQEFIDGANGMGFGPCQQFG